MFSLLAIALAGRKGSGGITRLEVLSLRRAMMERLLSAARQYSIIMCLKSFLKFCRTALSIACLDPAEIPQSKRRVPEVVYLTNDEVRLVLDVIDTNTCAGIRLRALAELLLSTGMRISEALSLNRDIFTRWLGSRT